MIGCPRFSSNICLISWRMIDMISFLFGLSASKSFFWSRLRKWKHDNRARCLASADERVRGCSLSKRKGFYNVARYDSSCDGIEQGFCCGVDFASVRYVMRERRTSDNE